MVAGSLLSSAHDHTFYASTNCDKLSDGIYDVQRNHGAVYVGCSGDTPEFAVTTIARWWEERGRVVYPQATQLLILADAGGSNGCRPRLWKAQLQRELSDRLGLCVTVCHYPTG